MSAGLMPKGTRQILLPASPWFIWLSLILAILFNFSQNFYWGGWLDWAPDLLAITLVFWSTHQPQRIGMGSAFMFGLIMDVHQTSLLGQHALGYTLLSFVAITLHRRVLWFKITTQAIQLLPLFVVFHLVELLLRKLFGGAWPNWTFIFSPLIETALWPVVSALLLMPQRRSPDPDATRPL